MIGRVVIHLAKGHGMTIVSLPDGHIGFDITSPIGKIPTEIEGNKVYGIGVDIPTEQFWGGLGELWSFYDDIKAQTRGWTDDEIQRHLEDCAV